jgi:hypothetical protein
MGTNVLPVLLLTVSKSEQKVYSLPPLGLEPVTFGTQAHLSDHLTKFTPWPSVFCNQFITALPHSNTFFGFQVSEHLPTFEVGSYHCAYYASHSDQSKTSVHPSHHVFPSGI